jgi:Transposase and inactivated derivatives
MDETYLKVKGKDVYLYRAVDKLGKAIDFLLLEKRDKEAALSFFIKALGQHGFPEKVTMDKSGANKAAIDEINLRLYLLFLLSGIFLHISVRQNKYLNNLIEQDHRHIKRITQPMQGFKSFACARATISGIELHHMIRKGQHIEAANLSIFDQFYQLAA